MANPTGSENKVAAGEVPLVRGLEPFERFYSREYGLVLALAYVLTGNPDSEVVEVVGVAIFLAFVSVALVASAAAHDRNARGSPG